MSRRSHKGDTDIGECEAVVVDEAAVLRAEEALPDARDMTTLVRIFGALGDPTRLRILSALTVGELCVCDLARLTGVSASAVSHQLRLLRDIDLVAFRRDGRRAVYALADEHVAALLTQGRAHASERP
ncbi:MAG: metalloregulator ArsR/SmtB family transcription factor [Coriobacteriia bacterium]